jgi:hypothetical protein
MVENMTSQNNVTRQISVAPSIASAPAPPVAVPLGFNALIPGPTNTAPAPTAPAVPPDTTSIQSADDLYWSKQPSAVQQLRNIGALDQRAAVAGQLAAQGYSIDVPVMVWGWDAGKTTQLRQGFGYTWVPAAMQMPVTAAPGITGASVIPYDPAHPPQGSIRV